MSDDGIRAAIKDSSTDAAYAAMMADVPDDATYLFTQTATGMGINLDGRITLHGVSPTTRWFTDRPNRIAGQIATEVFVSTWDTGDDNFAENPPNAVVAMFDDSNVDEFVVVLTDPKLDGSDLSYAVTVLDGDLAPAPGPVALFIDAGGVVGFNG